MKLLRRSRTRECAAARAVILLLLPVFAASVGCSRPADTAGVEVAAVPVSVVPVERQLVERSVEASGTLVPEEEVAVSGRSGGRVAHVLADVGDVVSGGAALARFECEDLERAVAIARLTLEGVLARLGTDEVPRAGESGPARPDEFEIDRTAMVVRARAQLENARARLAKLLELSREGQGFVAEQDLRDVETAVASAEAEANVERLGARALVSEARLRSEELALARLRLQDATLVAPAGRRWTVAARFVTEGELAAPGVPAFRLVACERVKLRGAVEERLALTLRPGQEAQIEVAAFGSRSFPGTLVRVSPTVDPQSRTCAVEVLVPNPASRGATEPGGEGDLRAGSFATARIVTATEEARLVPLDAVQSSDGSEQVFVLDGERVHARVVETGERHGRRVEVRGVEVGVQVVTRGQTVLSEGSRVRVVAEPHDVAGVPRPGADVPERSP